MEVREEIKKMNVQLLIDLLNDKENIPNPEITEINFIHTGSNNIDKQLEQWSLTYSNDKNEIGIWFWDKKESVILTNDGGVKINCLPQSTNDYITPMDITDIDWTDIDWRNDIEKI